MSAYYNEFDPKAAAWLRELIAQGHIAYGDVDERSIEDVTPGDLKGYTQCHFFAGIGVWSYALHRAGWADEEPVWTGSCPCQPFSAAGKGGGFADERHLWPAFHHLIRECRPPVVLGEQVASKDGLGWFDLVQADLEESGYAAGAVDLCAAGVGAPHIRQRLWWVGERLDNPAGARRFGALGGPEGIARDEARLRLLGTGSGSGLVENPDSERRDGQPVRLRGRGPQQDRPEAAGRGATGSLEHPTRDGRIERGAEPSWRGAASGRGLGGLADRDDAGLEGWEQPGCKRAAERPLGPGGVAGGLAESDNPERRPDATGRHDGIGPDAGRAQGSGYAEGRGCNGRPGPTNGFWQDADWLHSRDGKWRPVESGTFPLAHGAPARVGRLRGYGNAIVAPAAQAFIEAYLESRRERFRLMSDLTDDEDVFA